MMNKEERDIIEKLATRAAEILRNDPARVDEYRDLMRKVARLKDLLVVDDYEMNQK